MEKSQNKFIEKTNRAVNSLKEVNCFLSQFTKSCKAIQFAKSLKK